MTPSIQHRRGGNTPNDWTCPLCGDEMTGAQRTQHLRDEHHGYRPTGHD